MSMGYISLVSELQDTLHSLAKQAYIDDEQITEVLHSIHFDLNSDKAKLRCLKDTIEGRISSFANDSGVSVPEIMNF
jgi:hypothetical protein